MVQSRESDAYRMEARKCQAPTTAARQRSRRSFPDFHKTREVQGRSENCHKEIPTGRGADGRCDLGGNLHKPKLREDDMKEILKRIHNGCIGRTVMMGDWNARHVRMHRKTNIRDRSLVEWAREKGWSVRASKSPTFVSGQGRSTVDFFVYRAARVTGVRVAEDGQEGSTDHRPVIGKVSTNTNRPRLKRRISKARRRRGGPRRESSKRIPKNAAQFC